MRSTFTARARRISEHRLATVLMVSTIVCLTVVQLSVAAAKPIASGAAAIRILNRQRAENGIPPITHVNQHLATAWCPDESEAYKSGAQFWVATTVGFGWSAETTPWDQIWSSAPMHEYAIDDPSYDTAGFTRQGEAYCGGLAREDAPAGTLMTYAYFSELGRQHVPSRVLVEREEPFAPQQLVGVSQGRLTGPQPFFYVLGSIVPPQAVSWTLTNRGKPVRNVRFVDSYVAQRHGYQDYFLDGGVMVTPVLKCDDNYQGSIVWRVLPNSSSQHEELTQTFAFHTRPEEGAVPPAAPRRGPSGCSTASR